MQINTFSRNHQTIISQKSKYFNYLRKFEPKSPAFGRFFLRATRRIAPNLFILIFRLISLRQNLIVIKNYILLVIEHIVEASVFAFAAVGFVISV